MRESRPYSTEDLSYNHYNSFKKQYEAWYLEINDKEKPLFHSLDKHRRQLGEGRPSWKLKYRNTLTSRERG